MYGLMLGLGIFSSPYTELERLSVCALLIQNYEICINVQKVIIFGVQLLISRICHDLPATSIAGFFIPHHYCHSFSLPLLPYPHNALSYTYGCRTHTHHNQGSNRHPFGSPH